MRGNNCKKQCSTWMHSLPNAFVKTSVHAPIRTCPSPKNPIGKGGIAHPVAKYCTCSLKLRGTRAI